MIAFHEPEVIKLKSLSINRCNPLITIFYSFNNSTNSLPNISLQMSDDFLRLLLFSFISFFITIQRYLITLIQNHFYYKR